MLILGVMASHQRKMKRVRLSASFVGSGLKMPDNPNTDFKKLIYEMDLFEMAAPDSNSILRRVPGGWVYGDMQGVCFVPFHNEFMAGGSGLCVPAKQARQKIKETLQQGGITSEPVGD